MNTSGSGEEECHLGRRIVGYRHKRIHLCLTRRSRSHRACVVAGDRLHAVRRSLRAGFRAGRQSRSAGLQDLANVRARLQSLALIQDCLISSNDDRPLRIPTAAGGTDFRAPVRSSAFGPAVLLGGKLKLELQTVSLSLLHVAGWRQIRVLCFVVFNLLLELDLCLFPYVITEQVSIAGLVGQTRASFFAAARSCHAVRDLNR